MRLEAQKVEEIFTGTAVVEIDFIIYRLTASTDFGNTLFTETWENICLFDPPFSVEVSVTSQMIFCHSQC